MGVHHSYRVKKKKKCRRPCRLLLDDKKLKIMRDSISNLNFETGLVVCGSHIILPVVTKNYSLYPKPVYG